MKIDQITEALQLDEAKSRARRRINDMSYPLVDRMRAAALSNCRDLEEWDQINCWFDEIARTQPR